ncbi:MAG: MotA/TolQ/ExbB proton channel family protein [Ignavibacteria bacterium]|jgi:chemotaxis protein MotA|nr:MotA/TolQ/ExbB proton channel family protein [Ignavibacteria bacterium]
MSTLIGILLGIASIIIAFFIEQGDFTKLILPAPMIIVIGGTLMAGLASTSWNTFRKMPTLINIAFFPPKYDKKAIILQMIEFSLITRKLGMLALESKMNSTRHPYVKKIFQVNIDGADVTSLEDLYSFELDSITHRHNENIALFHKLGGLSPTMGIIGTVMGLISTMGQVGGDGDPAKLIVSISVAFLATLWGIALANLVWIPIADKLQVIHNEEVNLLDLIFEGAKCVLNGESPLLISSKLASSYPLSEQDRFHRDVRTFIDKQKKLIADVPVQTF